MNKTFILLMLSVLCMDGILYAPPKKNSKENNHAASPVFAQPEAALFQASQAGRSPSPHQEFLQQPTISAQEIEMISTVQALQEETEEEQQANLLKYRAQGWDLTEEDDASTTQRPPEPQGWLEYFKELPQSWWDEHVSNRYRVEHFMRFAKVARTYTILLQKIQSNSFKFFIDDLNATNPGEGNRWIDEALLQAVEDEQERITRQLICVAIPYKLALPPITRSAISDFLQRCAERKRKVQVTENEDYASDIYELARVLREINEDTPQHPEIELEIMEKCAAETIVALTKCASGGLLPAMKFNKQK